MSINIPKPSEKIAEQNLKNCDQITELSKCQKLPIINETKDQLDSLNNEMQSLSHKDFLKNDHADRLKLITESWIDSTQISENLTLEFNFSFTSEKINTALFQRTTAGQVLPKIVKEVTTWDGKTYSRKSLLWEFFAEDGKRLKIYDKTQITIGETRIQEDIEKLEDDLKKSLNDSKWVTEENRDLLSMWSERGIIDTELLLACFAAFFGKIWFDKVNLEQQEDFLTDIDRKFWKMNKNEKTVDKNNLTEENKIELLKRMGDRKSMDTNYENIEVGSHKRFLDFISQAEWTQNNYDAVFDGATQTEIKITSMSLREVLYYQENILWPSKTHTPVWKYQFNNVTLKDYIDRFGFSLDQKMDLEFQDKIAIIKMKEAGLDKFQSWRMSQHIFEENIAWTWAGFPKDASGKSYHHKVANNRAQVSYSDYSKEISYLRYAA